MASLTRKVARRPKPKPSTLDELLFGEGFAPNAACLKERRRIIGRFRDIMRKFDAKKPENLYKYLRDKRDEILDRPIGSHLDLIDDIDALRAVEAEERAGITAEKSNGAA